MALSNRKSFQTVDACRGTRRISTCPNMVHPAVPAFPGGGQVQKLAALRAPANVCASAPARSCFDRNGNPAASLPGVFPTGRWQWRIKAPCLRESVQAVDDADILWYFLSERPGQARTPAIKPRYLWYPGILDARTTISFFK